jgi:hypothetical protein
MFVFVVDAVVVNFLSWRDNSGEIFQQAMEDAGGWGSLIWCLDQDLERRMIYFSKVLYPITKKYLGKT